ncbi:hypothetical protein C8A00DRAFT_37911 [Chaetomidium leptoderma]|uniref:Uncharacterized protein n=1 Tax=Chaetomidium leptoderma TaxID=669021 RepID=A0AAN6ZTG9_9PEZI|nr:hypothetical protein C8A00DRAFT_37911 [Chaetomidium leptoderma]
MWTIGMVATISQFVLPPVEAGGYAFSLVALAMLYFAPIVGTMVAESWGHWFNDFLAKRHMERYGFEHWTIFCLPRHAALTGAWLNFGRVVGGFAVAYFQMPWVQRNGPALSFGCQGVVMVGAALVIVATQIWGRTWRAKFPAPGGREARE